MRKFILFFAFLGVVALNKTQAQIDTVIVGNNCGDRDGDGKYVSNIAFKLTGDSVLSIWGYGNMHDFPNDLSWAKPAYRNFVKTVVIGNPVAITATGDSIEFIGNDVFKDCPNIASITIKNAFPPNFRGTPFDNTQYSIPLYVPCGQLLDYQQHPDWSKFTNISEIIGHGTCGVQGNELTWRLTCDSTFTINGIGDMRDYFYAVQAPWDYYRDNIKTIIIGNGVSSISDNAFFQCRNLISVNISNSVRTIGRGAFDVCSSLAFVSIGNNVASIGSEAFRACHELVSLTIGNNVTSIGNNAFHTCLKLPSVTIPNSVEYLGDRIFYGCDSLVSVALGSNVNRIGFEAFSFCAKLDTIIIFDSVKTIGNNAFYYCSSLAYLTIGSSVSSIGDDAFYYCDKITAITVRNTTPPTIGNSNTFFRVRINIPVYVPCSSIPAYKLAPGWNDFTNYPGEIMPPDNVVVVQQDNTFVINWENTGALGYEVYRNGFSLGTVATNTYIDEEDLTHGANYCYKIKAIDGDCESDFSEVVCQPFNRVDIVGAKNISTLQVYPNPVNHELQIKNYESGDIEIYNIVGQKIIFNFQLSTFNSIDVSHLSSGMYFLKIDNRVVKFIKE